MKPYELKHGPYTMNGISLIEVLVALLLVSIAGFGVLAMSGFSTKESNSLRFEISADYLGRSLLSRAKTNIETNNKAIYTFDSNSIITKPDNCTAGCDATTVARLDIAEWAQEARTILPEVQYQTWWQGDQLHVAIAWTGPVKNNESKDCPFQIKSNQACRVYSATTHY